MRDIVDAVGKMPEVASVHLVDDAEKQKLLEPWLGAGGLPEDVRLPDLVVVRLRSDAPSGLEAVKTRVAALAPEFTIEDHARWQGDMLAFTHSIELLASIIIGLIAAAAVTTVIFVTKTGLSIHRRVIEIVHLVGAYDSYIAKQFLLHAMRLGLIGGIGGTALAGLTLIGLDRLLGNDADLAAAAPVARPPPVAGDGGGADRRQHRRHDHGAPDRALRARARTLAHAVVATTFSAAAGERDCAAGWRGWPARACCCF